MNIWRENTNKAVDRIRKELPKDKAREMDRKIAEVQRVEKMRRQRENYERDHR